MKLALVISSLAGGGAERVMTLLANAWTAGGVKVSLITLSTAGTDDAYVVSCDVERIGLGLIRASSNPLAAMLGNIRRIKKLRGALQELRPDVLISFMTATNVVSVLAANRLKLPVVVAERVAPEAHSISVPWRYLRKYAYHRASLVVAQTERSAEWLRKETRAARVEVVPNPIQVEYGQTPDGPAETAIAACREYNVVLGVGRLTVQKGFDLLLRAFAKLAPRHPAWRLVIFGEGPQGNALRTLAEELGISGRAIFPGFSRAIYFMMQKAQLFVLSSRYEGMPNALAEAMACGMPCISFDCPTGPAELIVHGHNGLLVPPGDVSKLSAAMDGVMRDEMQRRLIGERARESTRVYSMERVLSRWNSLLTEMMAGADFRRIHETNACGTGMR